MNRAAYLAGFGYIAVCGTLIYEARHAEGVVAPQVVQQVTGSDAQRWFARAKATATQWRWTCRCGWTPRPRRPRALVTRLLATRLPAASSRRARWIDELPG